MSKFKIGDRVVCTMHDKFFKSIYPADYVTVTGFSKEGYLLFNNELDEDGNGWFEQRFELYAEPENKVPDNMEVVGYQVKFVDTWTSVSAQLYADAISLGYDTRLMYAFKQD